MMLKANAMDITRLPPSKRTVHLEAKFPITQRDDFDLAMVEIAAGERSRMDALATV
jgi:hypothetical protein